MMVLSFIALLVYGAAMNIGYGFRREDFAAVVVGTALSAVAGWLWSDYWRKKRGITLHRGRKDWE